MTNAGLELILAALYTLGIMSHSLPQLVFPGVSMNLKSLTHTMTEFAVTLDKAVMKSLLMESAYTMEVNLAA